MTAVLISIAIVLLLVGILLYRLVRPRYIMVQPYQRGILTLRGVYRATLNPGGYWVSSRHHITNIDMRRQVMTLAPQEILTSDGLTIKLTLTGEFNVDDAKLNNYYAVNPLINLHLYAQAAMRAVVVSMTFEDIVQRQPILNAQIHAIVESSAKALGMTLHNLQIRDIILPGELKRAFAQALTAKKEGIAALERARGETAALRSLANAARLMDETPTLLKLRALQTMEASKGNTLVLGLGEAGVTVKPKS